MTTDKKSSRIGFTGFVVILVIVLLIVHFWDNLKLMSCKLWYGIGIQNNECCNYFIDKKCGEISLVNDAKCSFYLVYDKFLSICKKD